MDKTYMDLLKTLTPEQLAEMMQPYGQEQSVLDQEMALAQQLRERGAQRSSPWGAALGGLANAVGDVGGAALQERGLKRQRELGQRQQTDAVNRVKKLQNMERQRAMEDFLRQRGQAMGFNGPSINYGGG